MSLNRTAAIDGKLKAGTPVMFNGGIVYVEHDCENGFINLRDNKEKSASDVTFIIPKDEIQLAPKINKPLKTGKKPLTPDEALEKKVLNAFFNVMAELVPLKCMNCGKELNAYNEGALRAVTCHILPKKEKQFPELATDPDNVVFMGVLQFGSECGDHTFYDYSVENRMKMSIYPIVIKRYNEKLKHKLSEAKQILADEYLGITKKSNNLLKDIQEGVKV